MKPENNKYRDLDKMLWKEWRTRVISIFLAVVFIALIYFHYLPKETKTLMATTVSMGFSENNIGTRVFWVSKLDDGTLVRIPVTSNIVFKKGQRIKVIEISSTLGTKKYRLSKVLDEEQK